MIQRIILENYMSHASTSIELAAGLTVLIGPNNCGKSAVVSALQTLCGDNAGDFMVRHGARECSVTVELLDDDGQPHTITWRRRGKSPSYAIDGRDVHRIGRGSLPDDLPPLLRLEKVQPETGRPVDVHFGGQKEPIFLIDDESRTAAFFSASSDAERLLEMQKRHRLKVSQHRGQDKALVQEIEKLDAQLSTLAPLPGLSAGIAALEKEHAALLEQQREMARLGTQIELIAGAESRVMHLTQQAVVYAPLTPPPALDDAPALEALASQLQRAQVRHARLAGECQALSSLAAPPPMEETVPLQRLAQAIESAQHRLKHERHRSVALLPLASPPPLEDAGELERLCRELHRAGALARRLDARCAAVSSLCEPPAQEDPALLQLLVQRLDRASRTASTAAARQQAMGTLTPPPEPADPTPLADVLTKLNAAVQSANRSAGQLKATEIDLQALEEKIVAWVEAHPACPVCGGLIEAQNILAGGHGHD